MIRSPKYSPVHEADEIEMHFLKKSDRPAGSLYNLFQSYNGSDNANGKDDDDYSIHLAGNWRTLINTVLSFIGAGILGLPNSFRIGGLWLSLGTLIVASIGSMYCMWLLVVCKRHLAHKGVTSYSGVCYHALGRLGLIVAELSLVITQASFSISYVIFIGRNLHQIFSVSQGVIVLSCMPPLVALSLVRHPKYLAPFSLLAEIVNIIGIAVIVSLDFEVIRLNHVSTARAHWEALPFISGVFLYCFEGMGMVLSLEHNAKHKENFVPILSLVMVIYSTLCAFMGAIGYLAYGEDTQDIILLNIDNSSIYAMVVKISFCVGLYFTYPLMMLPVWDVIEPRLLKNHLDVKSSRFIRIGGVCLTGAIAGIVPSFSLFIGLIGSSCCSLLAFILPPLAYGAVLKANGINMKYWQVILHYCIITVGVLTGITGTIDAVRQLAEA